MTLLVQICIVIATAALVAMEVMVIRALLHAQRMTPELGRLTDAIERALLRIDRLADSSSELVDSVRTVVAPLRRASGTLAATGQRAADVSAQLLDEIEPPVRLALALSRGIRAGAAHLFERLTDRVERNGSASSPGSENRSRPAREPRM